MGMNPAGKISLSAFGRKSMPHISEMFTIFPLGIINKDAIRVSAVHGDKAVIRTFLGQPIRSYSKTYQFKCGARGRNDPSPVLFTIKTYLPGRPQLTSGNW